MKAMGILVFKILHVALLHWGGPTSTSEPWKKPMFGRYQNWLE